MKKHPLGCFSSAEKRLTPIFPTHGISASRDAFWQPRFDFFRHGNITPFCLCERS